MPILIVCPCASARGVHVLATAVASASATARIIRADVMRAPPRKKVGWSVSRAGPTCEDHPLAALSSTRGAQRCERALDPERRSEQAAHLVRRDDEGRAGRLRAQREEAGEQPTTGPQRAGEGADVLGAPRGIDRAIARVLPDAVERVGQVAAEREDVALLEADRDVLARGEAPRHVEHRGNEVEGRDLVAVGGEEPRVVTAAAARNGDATAGRRCRVEEVLPKVGLTRAIASPRSAAPRARRPRRSARRWYEPWSRR